MYCNLFEVIVVGLVQIVNLHYMLSKAVVKSRPTALWCYKDKLELSRYLLLDFFSRINYDKEKGISFLLQST